MVGLPWKAVLISQPKKAQQYRGASKQREIFYMLAWPGIKYSCINSCLCQVYLLVCTIAARYLYIYKYNTHTTSYKLITTNRKTVNQSLSVAPQGKKHP